LTATSFDQAHDEATARRRLERLGEVTEAGFAFAILLPLLFVGQITSAAPAISFAMTGFYAFVRRADLLEVMAARWPLLLFPAYALASTFWSVYPDVTLKHSLELCMTIGAGLLFAGSRRPASLLVGAWAAFALFLAVSLAFGHSVGVGSLGAPAEDQTAFAGLNGGKNLLGTTAAMGAMLSLFVLGRALRNGLLVSGCVALATLGLELYLVYRARSAGAEIALALSLAAFLATAALGAIRPNRRALACSGLVLTLTAGAMAGYAFANSVTAAVLDVFHKDPTLTGRSYLWYRSGGYISEHPILGRGFEAFWVRGDLDAEGLWQYGHVGQGGFNFHNTVIELLVQLGYVGTVLTIVVFLVSAFLLLRRSAREPTLVCAYFVSLTVFFATRTPFESVAPTSVDFGAVLLLAAVGYGYSASMQPAASPALRRPTPHRGPRVRARGQPVTARRLSQ
jgi:exopolysaccharide production protein ExoQ